MATGIFSDPTRNTINVNRPLRVTPVIPAVPRKFERNLTQTITPREQTGQDSQASSQKDCLSLKDSDTSLVKSEILNDSEMKGEGGLDKPKTLNTDAAPYLQDFGIEKHGHKLPPPFYPSKHNASPLSTSLPKLDTSQGQGQGSFANNQIGQQADKFTSAWKPNLYSNLTPPADDLPSPQESFYQGYGQFSRKHLHHRPALPIDTIPSPPEASYENYTQTPPELCNTLPNLSLDTTTPLSYSFYQGYTYGNVQPVFSPLTGPESPQHSSPRTGYDFNIPTNDERKSYSYISKEIEGELASAPDPIPLSIITHNTVVQTRDSPYGSVHVDESAGVSGITSESSFRYQASSQSSLGIDDDFQQQNFLEIHPKKVSTAKPIEYEAWRSSVLESLNDTLNVPLNQYSLIDHLLQQFDSGISADCHLELSHENNSFETTEFLLHSVVVTQSPLLKSSLNATSNQEDGTRYLQIRIGDRFITPMAVQAALRVCYGESSLVFNGSPYDYSSQSTAEVSVSWMENALAFAKAGSLLGLEAVTYRGLQIASKILNWENIETALSFLLGGKVDTDWISENEVQNNFVPSSCGSSDHEDVNNCDHKPDSVSAIAKLRVERDTPMLEASQKIHSPNMMDLFYQCLHFIIAEFPEAWDLNASSRPLADIDRLPSIPENRSPLSRSRLSLIQFGDHPSERAAKASDENFVLSSIMLSMPFVFIKYILDRLDESMKTKSLEKLIKERERRRHLVLKSDSVSISAKQAAVESGHAGWEEYLNLDQNSHLNIERKWTGMKVTP